jgi:hypothetical protein
VKMLNLGGFFRVISRVLWTASPFLNRPSVRPEMRRARNKIFSAAFVALISFANGCGFCFPPALSNW